MIGGMTKGQGVGGLCEYLLAARDHSGDLREIARVIGGTIMGESVRDLTRQFAPWRDLHPEARDIVIHNSLSFPPGERPSEQQQREIGEAWASRMGFAAYSVVTHGDHLHVAALRIDKTGKLVSTWQDWKKSERIIRDLEREHGLTQIASSHLLDRERVLDHKRAPTISQIEAHERIGLVPPSQIVSEAIDKVIGEERVTAPEFAERLRDFGIEARANVASTGRMNGFSYEIDGVKVTSKAMGKGYTWASLTEKGLSYDHARDNARLSEIGATRQSGASRDDPRQSDEDRAHDVSDTGPDRDSGRAADDAGDSAGDADQRERSGATATPDNDRRSDDRSGADAIGNDRDQRSQKGFGEPEQVDSGNARQDRDRSGDDRERAHPGTRSVEWHHSGQDRHADRSRGGEPPAVDHAAGTGGGDRGGSHIDHIATLAGLDKHVDRTRDAVERTLDALPAVRYEIGLLRRDAEPSKQMRRFEWTRERVLQSIGWLKRENALGREILFRPAETRYALVDDVKQSGVRALREAGHEPAAIIETSRDNLQVWVKLPHVIAAEERTEIGRELAREAGGDKGSVAWDKLGKLPGFTNRKPEHEFDRAGARLAPFVLLREAVGIIASRGAELIELVRTRLREQATQQAPEPVQRQPPRRAGFVRRGADGMQAVQMTDHVRQQYEQIVAREMHRTGGDRSAADFRATRDMIDAGYKRDDIAAVLIDSTHVAGRGTAGKMDYVQRTLDAASAPRAQTAERDTPAPAAPPKPPRAKDRDRDRDRDRGMER